MRRFFLLTYLTVTALVVAHIFNAFVTDALNLPFTPVPMLAAATNRKTHSDPERFRDQILSTSLLGTNNPHTPTAQALSASEASKKVRVLGTMVSNGRTPALVVLEELQSKRQRLYKVHDDIPGVGQLSVVRQDGIMIEAGNQREFLKAAILDSVVPSQPDSVRTQEIAGALLRRVVDRGELARAVSDLPKLLSQARAVPAYVNGDLVGWRIEGVATKSLFDKIGLRAGDVVQRINGLPLRDPGTILTLFQNVRDESHVQLDLVRQNQKVTLTYDIR
jgi:general secretion pathway protein C